MENILSILIWLPVVGMVAIAFIPREKEELIRITAAATTGPHKDPLPASSHPTSIKLEYLDRLII